LEEEPLMDEEQKTSDGKGEARNWSGLAWDEAESKSLFPPLGETLPMSTEGKEAEIRPAEK
jgi:hypothetical protein